MKPADQDIRALAESVANASYAIGWDGLTRQQQATECMRAGIVLRTDWLAGRERRAAERVLTEAAEALREHDDLESRVGHAAFQVAYSLLIERAALAAAQPDAEGGGEG